MFSHFFRNSADDLGHNIMTPLIAHSSERRDNIAAQLGSAHYSYVFVELAMIRLLRRAGYQTEYVQEPQLYKHEKAYRGLLKRGAADIVHIAFRSPENIRPMVGAKNVSVFFWEFDVMRDGGLITDSILANQVHMLRLVDEIWVGSEFTRSVLEKYGFRNAYVVPPPIIDASLPKRLDFIEAMEVLADVAAVSLLLIGGLTRAVNANALSSAFAPLSKYLQRGGETARPAGRVFLSILNPGDLRKNLLNIIEGFQIGADSAGSSDILILKLVSPKKSGSGEGVLIYDNLITRCNGALSYFDRNVILIFDYLSDEQMAALFSIADYYLSAAHCEGLNMPLLEAMSFGVVPVTTRNTAMLDYIAEENAVIIEERVFHSPIPHMAADVAGLVYSLNFASRFDIAKGCLTAMKLSVENYDRLSSRARQAVFHKYREEAVLALARKRLASLMANETGI